MDTYIKVSKRKALMILHDAIRRIDDMPENSLFTMNIDLSGGGCSCKGDYISMCSGEKMIRESATRTFSGNQYTSQLNLYSEDQPDIYNIQKKGIMKTILLPGI